MPDTEEDMPLPTETELMIAALELHGQLKRADSPDAPLESGQTHLLVERDGEEPILVEKRKSFWS